MAVISLAIGTGVNTAMFSVFDTLLLRPPALVDLERDVVVSARGGGLATSFPAFERYRQRGDVFSSAMAITGARPLVLGEGARRDQVYAEPVTSGYFTMTAIRLLHGAPFPAAVDRVADGPAVVVLGYAFWTRRFGSDPSIVGASVTLNGQPFIVTGVADEGFGGLDAEVAPDLWIPITSWARLVGEPRRLSSDEQWVTAVAKLAPGVSLAQAQAALAIGERATAPRQEPETLVTAAADGLHGEGLTDIIAVAGAAFGIGLAVLALACTNVANLLMARAAARRHDMAIRLALGSGRTRLVRLWVLESLLLSGAAAALGWCLASWLLSWLAAFRPPALVLGQADPPSFGPAFHLDLRAFAFTVALAGATAVLVGLLSGVSSSRAVTLTRIDGRTGSGRHFAPGFNLRSASIALQMALSTLLLIPSGLLVRSALRGVDADPGFDPRGVLLLPISADQRGVRVQRPEGFERDLAERVRRLPGVTGATVMDPVPLWFGGRFALYAADGQAPVRAGHASVGLDYFRTMRMALAAGRDFDAGDTATAPAVAIANEVLARRLWPDGHALGRRLKEGDEVIEIVGIARTAKYLSLSEPDQLWLYRPLSQLPTTNTALSLAVRTSGDPEPLRAAIEREVQALVPTWPGFDFRTLDEGVRLQRELPRLAATVLGALGGFGTFLAAIGIYGVMAFVVGQRRRELGIRLALGAQVWHVVTLVIRQGMTICLVGAGIGLALALATARLLASTFYGVGGPELLTCVAVPLLLMSIAFVACYVPTRRGARLTNLRPGD